MPATRCPRCSALLRGDDVPTAVRQRAAQLVLGGSVFEAVRLLHREAGLSLVDAKAVGFHLSKRASCCQRCHAAIEPGESAQCSKCKAATISW
jgi:hypothetical protein